MSRPTVTLRRGEATVADLTAALDALGCIAGSPTPDFVVSLAVEEEIGEVGPYSRGSDTSRYAALENTPHRDTQRAAVLEAIVTQPRTRDDLAADLGLPDSGVDGRIWELKKGGFVEDSPTMRRTRRGRRAHVLTPTPKGRMAFDE
jgi:DprA winged helix domain